MRPASTSICLTRIVGSTHEIEIAELRRVMAHIRRAVDLVIPLEHQAQVSNALLYLALEHMVQKSGAQETATTLIRLVDRVLEQDAFRPGLPLDLTSCADY